MIRTRNRFLASCFLALAVGAIANPVIAADPSGSMIWPTTGRITQPFGCTGFSMESRYGDCRHFHGGIDIANRRGTPIRAAADGVIKRVGWDQWGTHNWMVIIKHGDGIVTWYAHMRGKRIPGISAGVRVRQGDVIGYMSDTGYATGVHLHWAVLKYGRYVNPRNYAEGLPSRSQTSSASQAAATCDDVFIAWAATGATAVVLQGDTGSGNPETETTCAG